MAELEEVIETQLRTSLTLTTRIWPLILHADDDAGRVLYPAVTYQRIDCPREYSLSSDMGLPHPRIQIDSWGATYASAKAVATEVRGALQRWADADTSPAVLDCLLDSDEDSYEPDTNIYRVRQDWICWHRE